MGEISGLEGSTLTCRANELLHKSCMSHTGSTVPSSASVNVIETAIIFGEGLVQRYSQSLFE